MKSKSKKPRGPSAPPDPELLLRDLVALVALQGILASLSHPVAQSLYQRAADKAGITTRAAHVRAAYEYADLILRTQEAPPSSEEES